MATYAAYDCRFSCFFPTNAASDCRFSCFFHLMLPPIADSAALCLKQRVIRNGWHSFRLSMPIQLTFPTCWRSVIADCMLAIFDRIFVCVRIGMLVLTQPSRHRLAISDRRFLFHSTVISMRFTKTAAGAHVLYKGQATACRLHHIPSTKLP